MTGDEELRVPRSDKELRTYIEHYFAEYDELTRQIETGDRTDPGPIPSELIFDLLDQGRDVEAWALVAALVDAAPSSDSLGFVAAGALEYLVQHPLVSDRVLEEIVGRARVNPRLRQAFDMIYWGGEPDWFRSKIEALGTEVNDGAHG